MARDDDLRGLPGFLIIVVSFMSGSTATRWLEDELDWKGLSALGVGIATTLVVGYGLMFVRRWLDRRSSGE